MTREIEIERPVCEYAKSRGWFVDKVVSPGRRGFPDRVFIRNGRVVFCEFKAPGEKPTVQQSKRHREMRDHGAEVVWFDNLEAAKAFFK